MVVLVNSKLGLCYFLNVCWIQMPTPLFDIWERVNSIKRGCCIKGIQPTCNILTKDFLKPVFNTEPIFPYSLNTQRLVLTLYISVLCIQWKSFAPLTFFVNIFIRYCWLVLLIIGSCFYITFCKSCTLISIWKALGTVICTQFSHKSGVIPLSGCFGLFVSWGKEWKWCWNWLKFRSAETKNEDIKGCRLLKVT